MLNFLRPSGPRVAAIDAQDAIARVAAGALTLIDVRDGNELKMTGHAAGAIHIPLPVLRMKADPASLEFLAELSVDKPVALYCASGARSQMAAQMLLQLGFKEVYNLGGLHHWQTAGGAVTH
ncbi:rhodanese-like domain-containing protein [Actibacterium sp. MT2.3-13A]|uniref:rhodanese-like domain-containing protein n=1 Tax=Actibacterium sp. MT2.3-13A TaxID=2828332 RepID=UPI001BA83BAE|nr:rhodanese-like domain-containing protein [Actibacterium sp. MT2.3-13A]